MAGSASRRKAAVRSPRSAERQPGAAVHHGADDQYIEPESRCPLLVADAPQFINPNLGHILGQSLLLGIAQLSISLTVNGMIAFTAGTIAGFLNGRPIWLVIQRWLMGSVLTGIAVKMATDR